MPHEIHLTSLTPREAITDALHRALLGIDSKNHTLFESAISQSPTTTVIAGPLTLTGWPEIKAFFARVFEVVTTHITSNIRVNLKHGGREGGGDGDGVEAELSCHAIAYHMKPEDALTVEDGSYTAGCLYELELVREGEVWRIRRWEIRVLWTVGDRGVLHGEG